MNVDDPSARTQADPASEGPLAKADGGARATPVEIPLQDVAQQLQVALQSVVDQWQQALTGPMEDWAKSVRAALSVPFADALRGAQEPPPGAGKSLSIDAIAAPLRDLATEAREQIGQWTSDAMAQISSAISQNLAAAIATPVKGTNPDVASQQARGSRKSDEG